MEAHWPQNATIMSSTSTPNSYQQQLAEHPEILVDFQQILTPMNLPKYHLLHTENTVCNHTFIIEKGAARVFYYKDGKDITAHFAFDGQALTAIDSQLQGKKSKYNIELLEDSTLFSLNWSDLELLFQKSILHERFGRLFLQQIYVELVERIEDLQFHTAQERYELLIQKQPQILNRVALKHISSYLGITQETLSRIRANQT